MKLKGFYTVIEKGKNSIKILLSSQNHPIFKAHFPSNPILPAFIHLEIISELFKIEITQVKKAKLSEVIFPESTLYYIKENNNYKVFVNEKQVANFLL